MALTPYIISLTEKINEKPGKLVAINDYDFNINIKRIFYIYGFGENIENNKRGYHGHKNTTQYLIALNGSLTINTINDKSIKTTFILDVPNMALCIPPNNLIELTNISNDGVILALCDTTFKEDIYFLLFE
jgi:hypothetical protein